MSKKINFFFYRVILYYTAMIFAFSTIYSIITVKESFHQFGVFNFLVISFLFLIPNLIISICLFLEKKERVLIIPFILYWILQTVFVDISGFEYAITNGPYIGIGIKVLNGALGWNLISIPWMLEFTIKYSFLSSRTISGINLVAVSISFYLIYFYKKYKGYLSNQSTDSTDSRLDAKYR